MNLEEREHTLEIVLSPRGQFIVQGGTYNILYDMPAKSEDDERMLNAMNSAVETYLGEYNTHPSKVKVRLNPEGLETEIN